MAALTQLKRVHFGVPTRYAMTQMTVDELDLNANITLGVSYTCSGIDAIASVSGFYMFEDSRMHATSVLIVLVYVIIALVVAGAAIAGIRYTRLRKTAHGASMAKSRTNTTLGTLADEEVEQEIIDSENRLINRISFLSWIYEVGSNAYPLIRLWWSAIVPFFLIIGHNATLGDAFNGLVTLLTIGGLSWLIPFVGHRGESWGYKYRDAADRQSKQNELITKISTYQAVKQVANISSTGKII